MSEADREDYSGQRDPLCLCIPVHYDFASSLCYVAHRVLGRMGEFLSENSLELSWTPIDLAALMGWRRGAPTDSHRLEEVRGIATALGVPIRIPEYWLDSRALASVAIRLEEHPAREATWRERVFSAIYEEGRRPESSADVEGLLHDLDVSSPQRENDGEGQALQRRTARAREQSVTGVPTFMLGEWPFGGIQDESTMRSVLERWARRQRLGNPGLLS